MEEGVEKRTTYIYNMPIYIKVDKPQEYTITYNANGGSVTPSSKVVMTEFTYGDLPTPSRTGYAFNGWYTSKTGGRGTTYYFYELNKPTNAVTMKVFIFNKSFINISFNKSFRTININKIIRNI